MAIPERSFDHAMGDDEVTPKDLRDALRTLGWSQGELARKTSSSVNAASRWCNSRVPGPVEAYIKLALEVRRTADTLERQRSA